MTRRILVLGGSGMLGHKLVQVLSADPLLEVHATVRVLPPPPFRAPAATYHEGVDVVGDLPSLGAVLRRTSPDVVINAVGAIKQRKELVGALETGFFLNGTLPHLLPLLNPGSDAQVIHFSTDCVFVGDRGGYRESDLPDAQDAYGRAKACGELQYGRHLTIRTSIVGFETSAQLGLVGWFLSQPRGARLRGFGRAIFSGLPTVTLSRQVAALLHRPEPLTGLYHVASEPIDKFSLLTRLNDAFGQPYDIERDDSFVMDRSLDDGRFRQVTGTTRPAWDALIAEMRSDFDSLPYDTAYRALSTPADR